MWIKKDNRQIIVFIDPKGLNDEKIKLKDELKHLEEKLGGNDIALESFILSKTSYDKLIEGRTSPPSKEEYIQNHVLFLEDNDWQEKIFSDLQ